MYLYVNINTCCVGGEDADRSGGSSEGRRGCGHGGAHRLCGQPYTLNPTPSTLNPEASTLNHKSQILDP